MTHSTFAFLYELFSSNSCSFLLPSHSISSLTADVILSHCTTSLSSFLMGFGGKPHSSRLVHTFAFLHIYDYSSLLREAVSRTSLYVHILHFVLLPFVLELCAWLGDALSKRNKHSLILVRTHLQNAPAQAHFWCVSMTVQNYSDATFLTWSLTFKLFSLDSIRIVLQILIWLSCGIFKVFGYDSIFWQSSFEWLWPCLTHSIFL